VSVCLLFWSFAGGEVALQVAVAVSLVAIGSLGLIWQMASSLVGGRWRIDLFFPIVYPPYS
jgi:hypothetical protein